jgi:hypothetical protein
MCAAVTRTWEEPPSLNGSRCRENHLPAAGDLEGGGPVSDSGEAQIGVARRGMQPISRAAARVDDLARAAARVDDLVPPADELPNKVLVDNRRFMFFVGPLFTLLSVLLLPWIAYIAVTLPSHAVAVNYDIAWAGFDAMLLAALAASAYLAFRRSRHLAVTTAAAGTMLIVDAWFDVVTAQSGTDRMLAILFAVLIELPLATACWWISHQTEQFLEQRFALLLPRAVQRRLTRPGTPGGSTPEQGCGTPD